LALSIYIWE